MTKQILLAAVVSCVLIWQLGCASQNALTNSAAVSHLSGALTDDLYTSPNRTFSITLPVSAHKVQISDRVNSTEENVVIGDDYGMQLSVLVTDDHKRDHDWLRKWCSSLPAEVADPNGVRMKLRASMVSTEDKGDMVLLVKGPISLPDGKVLYIHNGIVAVGGKVYDFTATNHFVTNNMLGPNEKANGLALSDSKMNFDTLMSHLRLFPGTEQAEETNSNP